MKDAEKFDAAMRKAIAIKGKLRKSDPAERLMQQNALMHELIQAEYGVLKKIVDWQAAVLNVVSDLGDEADGT